MKDIKNQFPEIKLSRKELLQFGSVLLVILSIVIFWIWIIVSINTSSEESIKNLNNYEIEIFEDCSLVKSYITIGKVTRTNNGNTLTFINKETKKELIVSGFPQYIIKQQK
jgi:hypothetical protein